MVLKQRIDYGFDGYEAPAVPRGPRSVRRRASPKKPFGDSRICAFELLAAVAGKLLREGESSASSNAEGKAPCRIQSGGIKLLEHPEEGKALRSAFLDQGSCVDRVFVSGHAAQKDSLNATLREFPNSVSDTVLECTSVMSGSDISKQFSHNMKSEIAENRTAVENFHGTAGGDSPSCGQTCDGHVVNRIDKQPNAQGNDCHYANLTVANACSSKDPMEICVNTQQLINSDSSVKIPLCRDYVPNASFPRHRNNVKVGSRDDDENSVRCNRTSSWIRAVRPRRRIGHRKIRKLLTSKYWKVAPKLKDCEFPKFDGSMKHNSCTSRKALYTSGRIQHQGPLKKRKLSDHSSTLSNDREGSSESISNSPEKGMKGDKTRLARNLHRESGSSSVLGHQASFQLRDSKVKFSIKSFKVPELYVEVPETATVASLKRTVMEAVTAILQDGLHVGVLVQGKKVKDDNSTLLQTGISRNDNLDALGFILEPGSAIPSPPVSPKDPPTLLPCGTHQQLTRLPGSSVLDSEVFNASFDPPQTNNADNHAECNHEFFPSPADLLTDGAAPDSRALVVLPALNVEALSVAPVNPKSRRSEFVQRRTRRPFSVSEVEALVEAVEKLGTGRWRDVKLRAFENVDHRTYVDLKDKWKTLVHTASISPGQRRGEPVPQVLLDRVLSAHAYWSQHQSKQHGKHQAEPLTVSESHPGRA